MVLESGWGEKSAGKRDMERERPVEFTIVLIVRDDGAEHPFSSPPDQRTYCPKWRGWEHPILHLKVWPGKGAIISRPEIGRVVRVRLYGGERVSAPGTTPPPADTTTTTPLHTFEVQTSLSPSLSADSHFQRERENAISAIDEKIANAIRNLRPATIEPLPNDAINNTLRRSGTDLRRSGNITSVMGRGINTRPGQEEEGGSGRVTFRQLVVGEIVGGVGFEEREIYIRYEVEMPRGWRCAPGCGALGGTTQIAHTTSLSPPFSSTLSHPFEFSMDCLSHMWRGSEDASVDAVPVMYIEVFAVDRWWRQRVIGYGHLPLHPIPSSQSLSLSPRRISTFYPYRTLEERMRDFFVGGGTPTLERANMVALHSGHKGEVLDRYGKHMVSSGDVDIRLNTVIQTDESLSTVKAKSLARQSTVHSVMSHAIPTDTYDDITESEAHPVVVDRAPQPPTRPPSYLESPNEDKERERDTPGETEKEKKKERERDTPGERERERERERDSAPKPPELTDAPRSELLAMLAAMRMRRKEKTAEIMEREEEDGDE